MIKKLKNIDDRVIYVLILIALGFPIIKPVSLPFAVSPNTQVFYDEVAALEQGDVVVMSFNYGESSRDEQDPAAKIILRHLFEHKKGIKLIIANFVAAGPVLADSVLNEFFDQGLGTDWVYGEDWVHLGFLPGQENALSAFFKDINGSFDKDRRGNRTSELPILEGINNGEDVDLFIDFTANATHIPQVVRQAVEPYDVNFITAMASVCVASNMPYYNSGQITGYLSGLPGAGEYENIYGHAGFGTAAMDSYSFAHVLVLIFMIIGNITYYFDPERKQNKNK